MSSAVDMTASRLPTISRNSSEMVNGRPLDDFPPAAYRARGEVVKRPAGGAEEGGRARGCAGIQPNASAPAANPSCPPLRERAGGGQVSVGIAPGDTPDAILWPRVGPAGMFKTTTTKGTHMKNTPSRRVAYKTDHPELYVRAYWGRHPADDQIGTPEIIENRNRLAEEHGLESYFHVTRPSIAPGMGFGFDHPEGYRMADGRVLLLVSVGCPAPPYLEMQQVGPLYSVKTQSYIRVFSTLRQLKKAIETLDKYEGNPPDEVAELRAVEAMLADPASEGVQKVLAECRHCGRSFWFLSKPHAGPREWLPDNAKLIEFYLREHLGYGKAAATLICKALPTLSAGVDDPEWRAVAERRKRKRGGGA